MGESLAKTGDAKQPRLRNLPKDSAARALGAVPGRPRGAAPPSGVASLRSGAEGPQRALDPRASAFGSKPAEPSEAARMGEGQMALLGRRMKRLGEAKGLLGDRQEEEEEKGLDGEGGTQVPVYTARWGLGARCWPGCREGKERVQQ